MHVDRIKLILLIYVVQMNAYFYQISVLLYVLLCISAHWQHEYITLISKVVYKTQYYLHYLLSSIVNGSQIQYS